MSSPLGQSFGLCQSFLFSNCSCWLTVDSGLIWSFVGPALVIIVVRMIFNYNDWPVFETFDLKHTHKYRVKNMAQ